MLLFLGGTKLFVFEFVEDEVFGLKERRFLNFK
jgi:hypothetical protein